MDASVEARTAGLTGRAAAFASALLALVFLAGCGSFGLTMQPVLDRLTRAEYAQALTELEKRPERGSVLWQAQHGLLLRYAGRLTESNRAFAEAASLQEDLYTRSVSNEAASLAVNDLLRPYRARDFELPLLHVYPALNYLELGDLEGALVEARALSEILELRRAARGDPKDDWGLGRWLAGLIYEAGGEWNDAWISYGAARAAYEARDGGVPRALEEGLERTARRLGFSPDSTAAPADSPADPLPGWSTLVVWVERGFAPPLIEEHLRVPILESEKEWRDDRLPEWSDRVGERALEVRARHASFEDVDVAYFLDIALPAFAGEASAGEPAALVSLDSGAGTAAERAEDVDRLARDDLSRRYPGIAARTAARAIIKALATRAAKKKSGEVLGTLTNVLGVATERADTRCWATLPATIELAVIHAPPGSARIEVADGEQGSPRELATVDLTSGGWHFLSCRLSR